MIVAETFRRKTKMTSTTRHTVRISVNFTSWTESRIEADRSKRVSSDTDAGSCSRNVGSSALTASTTATTFVPGCLRIGSMIARSPLNHPVCLSSSMPSKTWLTSSSRTGLLPRYAMIIGAYACAFISWPLVCTTNVLSPYIVPVGRLTFAFEMADATSSIPMPCAASFFGSTSTRTAYLEAPYTCTCATPLTIEIR